MICRDCPRECGVDRKAGELGFCAQGSEMRVSRIALHPYEEPPISGEHGSGTVFFCGCSLRCVFCQNRDISRSSDKGELYSPEALAEKMYALEAMGASNINLVTPTHFSGKVVKTLEIARKRLSVPVVYNTSGYERVETLRRLDGLVDIYLPDLKYASGEVAGLYSSAPDYPSVAEAALKEMYRQVGECEFFENGTLKKGMIVRHLVLPSHRKDSMEVLRTLARILPVDKILLSLMSQYTPLFARDCEYKNLHRRLTRFEYESVKDLADLLGFDGFVQDFSSASEAYTPKF